MPWHLYKICLEIMFLIGKWSIPIWTKVSQNTGSAVRGVGGDKKKEDRGEGVN
jgi:hypothetical protein